MPPINALLNSALNPVQPPAAGAARSPLVGAASERFADVLNNTLSQNGLPSAAATLGTAPGPVASRLSAAAGAEGGRFGGYLAGADRAQVATSVGSSNAVANLSETLFRATTGRVEQTQAAKQTATESVQTLLSGGDIELHNVMLAAERSQLELQLTMQLRNKLVEAFREVMRTPL